MSPATGIGQLVGSLCAVVGVLVIALPIPIIGTNFVEYYQNENAKAGRRQRKEELEKAKRESARYQRDKNHPNGILDRSAGIQNYATFFSLHGRLCQLIEY